MHHRFTVNLILVALMASGARGDVIERRGGEGELEGVLTANDAGVTVRTDLGAQHLIPWDRVRAIRPLSERWRRRLATADDLWRARSRVERHDTTLAEPILARLFEDFRGATHETALVVAEGLLRCRLARGDHARAVIPGLETARLRRAGIDTVSYTSLAPALDPTYELSPALAPIWIDTPVVRQLERDLTSYDARGDAVIEAMAGLYLRAVHRTIGRTSDAPPVEPDISHQGVALLSTLIEAISEAPASRNTARARLGAMVADQSSWRAAWVHLFTGLSLLQETGLQRQHRAIESLLHLPARFSVTHPYLGGLALAYAADALERAGDTRGATAVRNDLARRFPHHPVREPNAVLAFFAPSKEQQ